MKWTKKWGTVNGNAELYMLNHAERTRKELRRKNESSKRKYSRCQTLSK